MKNYQKCLMALFLPWIFLSGSNAGPSRVISLYATNQPVGTEVVLTWTAPIPSGVFTNTLNDLRMGTNPINVLNWNSHTRIDWLNDAPGDPGTVQTATIIGLTTNTTYYFALKVQDGSGTWSKISNLTYATTRSGSTNMGVTLAWDASPDERVTGYKVYYSTVMGSYSGSYSDSLDTGLVTTGRITNLTSGVTYYFVATAYTAEGLESLPSNEIAYTPP